MPASPPPSEKQTKSSVYDDVLKRGSIRCGYFEEAPFTIKDLKTGKMHGIAVELIAMIGKDLGLKVEWVESVNFGTLVQDLQNKRYDAICSSVFTLPRGGQIDYTTPYTVVPVYGYVRPDDVRFDQDLMSIDWTTKKIAGIDGEGATTIATKLLPDAQFMRLPQSSQIAEMLLSVAQKKADIGFTMPSVYAEFNKNNPDVLKEAQTTAPLYKFAVAFAVKPNESAWKNTLDYMLRQYIVSGELNRLIDKYDPKNFFGRM
jgi:ABC-type amino acid transport substrate-binding protein